MPPRHRIVAWLTVLAAMVAAVISLHRAGLLWLPYLGTRAVRPPPQRSYLEGAERRCRRGTIRRLVQGQRATFYCPVCQR